MDVEANLSLSPSLHSCSSSIPSRNIFTSWFSVYLLFLPVFLLVLYIGFNKWRRPQSAAGGLSHSDVFTLHMVLLETACVLSSWVIAYGYHTLSQSGVVAGAESVFNTTYTGQVLFHSLTCVERYLAVVHPVSYLRLRREGGATLRNTCISVVWVLCVVYSLIISHHSNAVLYGVLGLVVPLVSFPLVAFCSIKVLIVLTRPKPGERGGLRRQVDQSKRSTVHTLVAILGALLLRLVYHVVNGCVNFWFWGKVDACVVIISTLWVALPSSLVLPLLFLHRDGRLPTKGRK